ncbi:transporter substrate-binding domain-containing protein [Paenibacillus larvae]
MKKLAASVLSLVLAGSLIAGCGQKDKNAGDAASTAAPNGKLVLATSADYPPYEFHKLVDGKDSIIGFDIEIAKEIVKDMGKELEVKDMRYDALLAALQSGTADIVIAGMTPTPERQKNVDFSDIYYTAQHAVVTLEENKDKYKNPEDLKGKKIVIQKGSIQEEIAKRIEGADLQELGKIGDLIQELKNKRADASIIEKPVAANYVKANKGLAITDLTLQAEDTGSAVAIKKGNKELVDQVNKTLKRLKDEKKMDQFIEEATKQSE